MDINQAIDKRFAELIEEGNQILRLHGYNPNSGARKWSSHPSDQEYNSFFTSAKNLLNRVAGTGNVYTEQMDTVHRENKGNAYYFDSLAGIIKAGYDDWKAGLIGNFRNLVAAELLTDFIDQAEQFLGLGYKMPAAVIIGSVIEDSLRKLCTANMVSLPAHPKIDTMNVELAKKGVYNANVQKQITAWAGLRNSAAHGKGEEFTDNDVKNMIQGVIEFNSSYLN